MELDTFCKRIGRIDGLTNAQKAIAILFFFDQGDPGIEKAASELAREIKNHAIGNPNPSHLAGHMRKTGCVYSQSGQFRLKQDKRDVVRSWISTALDGEPEEIDGLDQFLNQSVWKGTRGYIEKVSLQLNGCYSYGYFDAASVMIRRLVETLIIESYEKLKCEGQIKDKDSNYFMLSDLIAHTVGTSGLPLGRETKRVLKDLKVLGDRSAHSRRYNAKKPDLDRIRDGLRIVVEELLHIAGLYRGKPPEE